MIYDYFLLQFLLQLIKDLIIFYFHFFLSLPPPFFLFLFLNQNKIISSEVIY